MTEHLTNEDGIWIIAFITMIGGVFAGLFKLLNKNGCRVRCFHPNGTTCCDTDCDEGREQLAKKSIKDVIDSKNIV